MSFDLVLEFLGLLTGLLYLWWEYQADSRVWLVGMIMPLISMWVYFSKGLYADFGINIYYLLMAVYGYYAWTRKKSGNGAEHKEKKSGEDVAGLQVSHTPLWAYGIIIAALAMLWWLLWWILSTFTDSTVPVADAFTTALSIVGMWMMARKFAEQWIAWFIVDIVCVALYIYKGLIFYPVLYAVYTIISVFGYRKWVRMIPAKGKVSGDK